MSYFYHLLIANKVIPITFAMSMVVAIAITIYFSQLQIAAIQHEITSSRQNMLELLSGSAKMKLTQASTLLKISSNSSAVRNVQYADKINATTKGIPVELDYDKRQIANNLIISHPDFEDVFFLLPDGTMYMLEPYARQSNLARTNFASSDYYKGAIETHDAYLSEVEISNNNAHNVATIAVPVYSEATASFQNGQLRGIWAATLNLTLISKSLSELDLGTNGRLIFLDQHGKKVADSEMAVLNSNNISDDEALFGNLKSFNDALAGRAGTRNESIDGKQMFVVYHPVKLLSNTWVLLFVEPYDDAFQPVILAQNQLITMVILLIAVGVLLGLFLRKNYKSLNKALTELTKSTQQVLSHEKELEKANQELLAIEKSKDEFVSMVSHELKTPLVPIKGFTQMLLKPEILGQTSEKQKQAIESILRSCNRLESLIQDILDVYKLDIGKLRLSKVEVDLSDMINQLISDLNPITDEKKIELKSDLKTSGNVFCDRKRIEQVFSNLVKNSVDFVPAIGGKITIRAEDYFTDNNNSNKTENPEPTVLFTVEDNGVGIPPDKADDMFKKFYQLDTSASRKHGGSGLGLAICKGLVEAHGGRIWIDKTYRNGASVKFILPRTYNKGNELSKA